MARQFEEFAPITPVQHGAGDKITSRVLNPRLRRSRFSALTRREFCGSGALAFFPQTPKPARPNVVIIYVNESWDD